MVMNMQARMQGNALYFLHILKTAGTSVISWLRSIGGVRACPEELWSLLLQRDRAEVREYDLYCGHFYCDLEEYLDKSLDTLTFLRNPVERAFSHFRHILRDPHHHFHERVRGHGSFKQFMMDPLTRPLIENFQVRALSARFQPWTLLNADAAQAASRHHYWLEQYIETTDTGLTAEEALFLAKDALLRCKSFGIVERMADSTFLMARELGVGPGGDIEHLNADWAGPRLRISRDEWRMLANLLQADLELYEFALRLFDARLCRAIVGGGKGLGS